MGADVKKKSAKNTAKVSRTQHDNLTFSETPKIHTCEIVEKITIESFLIRLAISVGFQCVVMSDQPI